MAQEPTHMDAAIAELEGWKERISTAIETMKALSAQAGALPAGPPPGNPARAGDATINDIPHDAFFQMTVPDAAEKYLTLAKTTKPNAQVAEALLRGGLKSAAKNFRSMLNTVLSRESRFVKVNGEWGLTAWYPGMRRGPRIATGDATARPAEASAAEKPKKEESKNGFSPDSLRGRALQLLDSKPGEMLGCPKVAEQLKANAPSVSAALFDLYSHGFILRPERGKFKSKKSA